MTTPYSIIRCRMKDLISCFNACKLPIDKDREESNHRKRNTSSISDDRKCERDTKVEVGMVVEKGGGEESPTSWQSCESEEDDYIVFYFKDDDAGGGVMEERGLESSSQRKETCQKSTCKIQAIAKLNESEQHRYTISESSDSSTSSFAFPIIQREWTGSPALMPRLEGHNKSCRACIQCCKF